MKSSWRKCCSERPGNRLALPLLDQLYSDRGCAAPAEDATTKGLARELVLRLAGARRRSPATGVQIADNA